MKNNAGLAALALFFVLIVLGNATFFIVPEGIQALVFRFGKISGEPKTRAGLYMKIPLIENVQFLEKRILNWDGIPERVPTGDKKYLIVDTTARWQITDPLLFRKRLENVERGQSRIKNVIDSATRSVISSHNLVETVRDTNDIFEELKSGRHGQELDDVRLGEVKLDMLEEEVFGEVPRVEVGREELSRRILAAAQPTLKEFGITLRDVQLRRIAYEESVEQKVYDRMISERNRIAEKIISYGKGEQARISGRKIQELQKIESEAYLEVQKIKGSAEAQAISIYAGAMKQDENFYEFARTMELYKQGLRDDVKLILSSQAKFIQLLTRGDTSR